MAPDGHEHDHADHHHDHAGVRGLLASLIGHSHDPGDSIDDALTAESGNRDHARSLELARQHYVHVVDSADRAIA